MAQVGATWGGVPDKGGRRDPAYAPKMRERRPVVDTSHKSQYRACCAEGACCTDCCRLLIRSRARAEHFPLNLAPRRLPSTESVLIPSRLVSNLKPRHARSTAAIFSVRHAPPRQLSLSASLVF